MVSGKTANLVPTSQSPQGGWVGVYGADGYALLGWNGGDLVSMPKAGVTVDQVARFIWTNNTTAVPALQSPDTSSRQAACVYDANQVTAGVTAALDHIETS